jgi:hypothetical protein
MVWPVDIGIALLGWVSSNFSSPPFILVTILLSPSDNIPWVCANLVCQKSTVHQRFQTKSDPPMVLGTKSDRRTSHLRDTTDPKLFKSIPYSIHDSPISP